MARTPKITVQGWTADGPVYTIHHSLSGWRNRKHRRAGTGGEELVGDHDAIEDLEDLEGAAAYMLFAKGDTEVYAFKGGYVYQVTLLVDGDPIDVLVDARPGDRIERMDDDIQLLEQRALEGDELERALAHGPAQTEAASDGAESQEEHPSITALTGAQTEDDPEYGGSAELTDAQVDELDTAEDEAGEAARDAKWTAEEQVPITPEEADALLREKLAEHADQMGDQSELTPEAAAVLAERGSDDDDDSSTGPHNYDGTVAEFAELVEAMEEEELQAYREQDTRKGVREAADHELLRRADEASLAGADTAGGNGAPASSEEE